MPKKLPKQIIAEGITHIEVNLDSFLDKSFREIRKEATLQVQGEPAEIKDSYPIPILLTVLDALHGVSPELVLKTAENGRILIFDHQSIPVLRDKDIFEQLTKEAVHRESGRPYEPALEIDIEAVWRETGETGHLDRALSALKKIKTILHPTEVATLIGSTPPLLFLLVYHLLYGLAGEVWYQETKHSQAIRVR